MEIILNQYMPLLTGIGAFVITYMIIPVVINVSHLKHLCDDPEEERKLHIKATPNLGGVAIFAAIFIAYSLSGYAFLSWSPYLAAGLTILFLSGIKDDILVISPLKKLVAQIVAVAIVMWQGDLIITHLGGIFGFHQIPLWAGAILTLFTMIVVINAYNLIDGIDGLAGGIGIIASSFFSWWFFQMDMLSYAMLSIALTGALLAFMRYNFQPASIFMGDTGSQIVGYLLAFFAVSFVNTGLAAESTVAVPFAETIPVIILAVLIVPLYDTLRVFLVRACKGQSPFQPDRLHVHHQLLDLGFSHRACCFIIFSFNLMIIGLTMLLNGMEINLLFGTVLLTTMILFPTVQIKRNLLKMMGVEMPTARYIKIIEWKFGTWPHEVDQKESSYDEDTEKYREIAV